MLPHEYEPEDVFKLIESSMFICMDFVRQVNVPYAVTSTDSQISSPSMTRLTPDVFVPKPVPVTTSLVPPELPTEGDIDTRVGVVEELVYES